ELRQAQPERGDEQVNPRKIRGRQLGQKERVPARLQEGVTGGDGEQGAERGERVPELFAADVEEAAKRAHAGIMPAPSRRTRASFRNSSAGGRRRPIARPSGEGGRAPKSRAGPGTALRAPAVRDAQQIRRGVVRGV